MGKWALRPVMGPGAGAALHLEDVDAELVAAEGRGEVEAGCLVSAGGSRMQALRRGPAAARQEGEMWLPAAW